MNGNLRLGCLLLGLLQVMPLLINAQEGMTYKGPVLSDPIPQSPPLLDRSAFENSKPLDSAQSGRGIRSAIPSDNPLSTNGEIQIQQEFLKGSQEVNSYSNILDYWFGELTSPDYLPKNKMVIWFGKDQEIDRQILDAFEPYLLNVQKGGYNSWRNTPRGRLALVLLLDQFPRHAYRNKPQEFMLDRMARALVLEGIQKGDDRKLYPIERAFFYLPLEHSEDQGLQNLSIANYQQLLMDSPEQLKPQMQDFLQTAIIHQQQIARFGRFPYRNVILGRESTPEETVFLIQTRNLK